MKLEIGEFRCSSDQERELEGWASVSAGAGKYVDFCLVYDCPIKAYGLLWKELVEWWREREEINEESDGEVARKLYARLAP